MSELFYYFNFWTFTQNQREELSYLFAHSRQQLSSQPVPSGDGVLEHEHEKSKTDCIHCWRKEPKIYWRPSSNKDNLEGKDRILLINKTKSFSISHSQLQLLKPTPGLSLQLSIYLLPQTPHPQSFPAEQLQLDPQEHPQSQPPLSLLAGAGAALVLVFFLDSQQEGIFNSVDVVDFDYEKVDNENESAD